MCFYIRSPKKRNPIKQYEAALLRSLKPGNHADTATFRRATKVLLLGPSGSGKSTIIRKLRMQSGIRIPDDEREQVREAILSQMHDALVASIAELKVRGALDSTSMGDMGVRAILRLTRPGIAQGTWTRERLAAMRTLYEEPSVLDTALRRRDTAGFIKRLLLSTDNVLQPEWRPTDADVMQCHVPDQALTGAWVSKDVVAFEQSISVKDELCGAIIQLMDSVVFILDLSGAGVLGKDHLDIAFDSLAHILNHRSIQKKPIQILLNKTDIFPCNINEVLLPDAKHPFHRTSIDGVARYLAEYMGGLERLHVRCINALSAGWMQRMLEDWRLMAVYKNLVQFGLVL